MSILSAMVGFWLFTTDYPAIFAWLLHLTSIALLVLSIIWMEGFNRTKDEKTNPWTWLEIGLLLAIFGIAIFMRVYRLDQVPFGTWYDEADEGLNALNIIRTPGFLPVFADSTRLPAHLIYLIIFSFKIFGSSTLAIRAVSIAFGLGTVAAAFFAGSELFDRRTGFVLAFLLAVSRWDINWSRIGMHGITVPFFELLSIGFILRAMRRQRLLDYTLAGLTVGFGLCFYVSFRLFPVIIGLFLLVLWLSRHDLVRSSWRGFLILLLGVFIAAMPVIQFAVMQPDAFWGRVQDISIFKGKTTQAAINSISKTTLDHVLMFNYKGDRNGRHNLPGEPMLDPISGCLLVLGVALSLRRIRHPASFLLLAWLFLMLAPAIFSLDFESPQSYRAIGSLPAAYLLAVVPIQALWQEWDKFSSRSTDPQANHPFTRQTVIFAAPLILVLGILGYYNYHIYFDKQANSFDSWTAFSTPDTIVGNVMRKLGNQVDYYVSTFYYQVPTVAFLAPDVVSYHRLETHATLPLALDSKKGVVLFVDSERKPFFQQAQQYYPHATFQEFKAPDGQTALYEIYLKPEDIAASQGLVASYYSKANWSEKPVLVRNDANFNFDWKNGDPAPYPFGVEWKGVLFVPEYGTYHLAIHSPSPTTLFIDEVPVTLTGNSDQTAAMELARGNHSIRIRATAQDGHFELLWQPPSGVLAPIPLSSLLLPPITNNGLVGRYYANGNWQEPPAYIEIDPWIHFYFHNPPLPRPYTVEWTGKIKIANAGQYQFELESIDDSSLFIDGTQIIDDQTPNQGVEKVVALSSGFHLFKLRFADRTGSTHINLYWSPPGSGMEVIPSDVLFPLQAGEQIVNTVQVVSETPAQPAAPVVNTVNTENLPDIKAQLLWQAGGCGSGGGQLQSPHGLSVDQQGNVWVADTGNHRIVGINSDGKFFKIFGQDGKGDGQFLQPYDLVVEHDGSIVVLDSEKVDFLQRFSQAGDFIATFGSAINPYNPRGLAIDNAGDFYIADTGGTRLIKITSDGNLIKQWINEPGKFSFNQLVGVAAGSDGVVYVVDPKGSIWKLLPDGSYTNWPAFAPVDTATGSHLAIGPNQVIYVTDPEKQRVVSFTANGKPVGQLGATNKNPGMFSKPVGLAIGPGDTLFISDSISCQISAFKLLAP